MSQLPGTQRTETKAERGDPAAASRDLAGTQTRPYHDMPAGYWAHHKIQRKASASGSALPLPPGYLQYHGVQGTVQRKGDAVGPGYVATGSKSREWGFALRHPLAALAIGSVSSKSNNISTRAVRFSTNKLGLQETPSHEGSEVNAFRHTLWQADITKEHGVGIAKEVGNAHEDNPFAINGGNRKQTEFATSAKADESCDLRNNEIGRSIGQTADPVKMNQLALRVLEAFHDSGLWVSERTPGGKWRVVQKKVADAIYQEAKARLLVLNENGRDAAQQAEQDAEDAEQQQRMLDAMLSGMMAP